MCFTSQTIDAQNNINNPSKQPSIEGLSIYPNPVSSQQSSINIVSTHHLVKTVEIFDVLGKRVFSEVLSGEILNISALRQGIYILRITENNISESRKLIIK